MTSPIKVQRKSSISYENEVPMMSREDAGRLPAAARFVETLKNTEANKGAMAYFECKIKGNPFPDITWFKDGFQLEIPTSKIWTETCRDGKHTLVIQEVGPDDGGSYRCTAINKLGRDSSMALLQVTRYADDIRDPNQDSDLPNGHSHTLPDFVVAPQSVAETTGGTVNFGCQVVGLQPITVEWFKDCVNLTAADRHFITFSREKSNLQICNLSFEDAGSYKCVASNKAGKSTCLFELDITGDDCAIEMSQSEEPYFIYSLQSQRIRVGDRVRLECKVEGKPKPSVSWTKDGRLLKSSSRAKITEVCGNHSLVIFRAESLDCGVYSLTATNHCGSKTSTCELEVEGANPISSPSRSTLASIDKVFQSRRVSASGSASPFGANLKSPMRGGGGQQRKRGPGFILRPRPQNIASGERLVLKCTLLGHPKPTVTWQKEGELLDEDRTDGRVLTRNDGNDYFLEIEETNPNDAGKYTVTARNSLGKQTATVEVTMTGSEGSVKPASKATGATKSSHGTNGTMSRHNDTANHEQQSSLGSTASEDDRKPQTVVEHSIPSDLKSDNNKYSSTSSITSTMSSKSRFSSSSSASKHDADADDRIGTKLGRRKQNMVAPAFIRRLSSTQVSEGDELLLQCEVTGEPEPRTVWKRNGTEVGVDEDEVFTSYREGVARLRLRDVQSLHAGEYVCVAKNDAGSVQCSSRVTVKAKRMEMRPKFKKSPSDVRATEGETLTLEAEVVGVPVPEIVWSLDGEEITNGDVSYNNNVARLVLHNVTPTASGQYMCNALNSSGEDSVACRVRVKAKKIENPPEFTSNLSDVIVEEGEDLHLRCVLTETPQLSVQWQCNDETLEEGDGIKIKFRNGVASLSLEQTVDEDSGVYSCVATNNAGTSSTSCNVTIKIPRKPEKKSAPASPPKFLSTFDEYIRVQEGETLTLQCDVSGSPTPDVKWIMDGKEVENSTTSFENGHAQIVISPITSDHAKSHLQCEISNSAGKKSHQAKIYVRTKRVAPVFESKLPESVNIYEGEEAYFECKVTGHPQPRVSWTRDGRSLSVLSTETSYENGVASVRIRKAGPREGGKYVCVARNLSGEVESVCMVRYVENIKKPREQAPIFASTIDDVILQDGQDLHLECKVTGDPDPIVTWELDGQTIEHEEGDIRYQDGVASLTLEDAMPEDSGQYTCIATNSAGKATCSCRVTVQEAKKIEAVKPLNIKLEPSFPVVLEDVTIKEEEDIFLTCQATGNPTPTIKWLFNGDEITDGEIKYHDDGVIELLLKDAVPGDEGVYTCIAESPLKRVMTSCKVSIDALPRNKKKKNSVAKKQSDSYKVNNINSSSSQVDSKPSFIQPLEDAVVQDGSTEFGLMCRVTGNPTARWFHEEEEIEESEDFQFVSDGDIRKLEFAEVFPDDSGTYTCVITNESGEARCSCMVNIQEIDGEAPTFVLKPKPVTVSMGGNAAFTCRVDGDPQPSVQWLFCNQPIENDRARITGASPDNNYTHTLVISQVSSQDAGRYSVCCRNLLGDVTCTVSLIVDDAKRQESRKDFRDVLKKSSSPVKTSSNKPSNDENMDYRSFLKKTSERDPLGRTSSNEEEENKEAGVAYKEVLSNSVKTKALTEDQRKMQRAEQKDFRKNLVRKVDTKVVTQDALRHMTSDQLDFRDETLKKKVETKAFEQDALKTKSAEQKDFRSETLKSKVVTKAYKEEEIKAKRPAQVDFRNVLSSTKQNDGEVTETTEEVKIADITRAKWKKEVDHTTVSTKRARRPGPAAPDKKVQHSDEEEEELLSEDEQTPEFSKPEFIQELEDIMINDSEPFELVCKVIGNPRPDVKWLLDDEEVAPEDDVITMTYEDDVSRLMVAESFPEDQGRYTCKASNNHGETSCSCYVTVIGDDSKKTPVKILSGPKDCVINKGDSLCLECTFEGAPPIKVVWRKGKKEIISSSSCRIFTSEESSKLKIGSCESENSGCYTLQLSNDIGVEQCSVSVQVVDVPDPPGKPFTDVRPGKGIIVSWYGCAYDGGSHVTQYSLEMLKVSETRGKKRIRWIDIASTDGTSYTVGDLEHNTEYKFRVLAKNKHGWSKPGISSDPVRYSATIENGTESTDEDDEENFVKYEPVLIEKNKKFSSKYEIREKLGQGRFGKVHRVVHRKSGQEFAAKIMRALKAKDRQAVALEIEIMNQLRHPKLVQLIEAYQQEREVTMVMDLVSGGELFERVIDDDFVLTEAACIKYMRQICHGVKFMHDNSVIHLDLKPENIMCVDKTGTRIKLIDFGLARKFNPNDPIRVMFGTPEFVAPEVINYDTIGFQTDMWSVGVICYILLSGLSPFSGDADTETLSNVTAVAWDFDDEAFEQISNDAKDFISQLLVKNLRHRYTVDQAINHTWLKKNTNKMKKSKLDTRNLRRFLARRRWQKTGNAVRALGRLATLAKLSAPKVSKSGIVERESGFLSSLRAELEREKEAEKKLPDKQKPEFIETFSDSEVIDGTAACFSCVIAGIPDPQVTWYFEGNAIKSTRRIQTSYNEDGASLLIKNACERDEGMYTCKAVNPEGEISHSAELIVIKL